MEEVIYYKLTVYVPENHIENVKQALFDAGAGKQGNYEQCSWQTLGQGQFRPLAKANPVIGERNNLNFVTEYKIEMLCSTTCLNEVIQALKANHPYEEPAFDIIRLENRF